MARHAALHNRVGVVTQIVTSGNMTRRYGQSHMTWLSIQFNLLHIQTQSREFWLSGYTPLQHSLILDESIR
jgi:hypothetical protein